LAGWMDSLLASGWVPVGQGGAPAQFDEYGQPVPVQPAADPFPEIKKPKAAPIASWGPMAGLLEPNVSGQFGASGQPRDYHPDPMMPGTDYPAIPTPAIRQMQSLVDPSFEQTAERVPMPRERPHVPSREADGETTNMPTDVSSSNRGSTRPPVSAGVGGSATPMQPPMQQPQQPQAPQGEGFSPGAMFGRMGNFLQNNSNTLLALGAGFAGAPNIGQGISRAASAAIPASQADIKNRTLLQSQSSTYRSLIEAGVPPNQALGAIGNPDMMKALVKSYIEDRGKEIKIVKDGLGNEVPYVVNKFPKEGEPMMTPALGGGGGSSGGEPTSAALAHMEPQYDPTTHRDEAFMAAFKKADPINATAVEDMVNGKLPGTGRNMQQLMKYAARYEQGFEGNHYQARQALEKSYFGGGEGGKALRSANTTIDHGIQLSQAIKDLHNFTMLPGFLNPATGAVEKQFSPKYQAALKNFQTNAELYAKELDFALTGKSTVSGQNHIREMFDKNASPEENMASLTRTLEMLEQRINEHETTYRTGMNRSGGAFAGSMLTNREKLDKLLKGEDTAAPKPAAAPKPGRYRYDPNTGNMALIQ
jgi:hypothetical protein